MLLPVSLEISIMMLGRFLLSASGSRGNNLSRAWNYIVKRISLGRIGLRENIPYACFQVSPLRKNPRVSCLWILSRIRLIVINLRKSFSGKGEYIYLLTTEVLLHHLLAHPLKSSGVRHKSNYLKKSPYLKPHWAILAFLITGYIIKDLTTAHIYVFPIWWSQERL